MAKRWLLIGWFIAALGAPPGAVADPLPVETFFRFADIDAVELSPSGRWLAIGTGAGSSRVGLIAIDLQEKEKPRLIARFSDADVSDFHWVNDDRVVFRIVDRDSGSGDQPYGAGLYSARHDGSELRPLIRVQHEDFVTERRVGREALDWNHDLLFVPNTGGDEVIVGEWRGSGRDVEAVLPKRLNIVTRRTESLYAGAPDWAMRWLFDPAGEPRLVGSVHEGQTTIYWRAPGQSEWVRIARFPTLDAEFSPQFVTSDGVLYVTVARGKAGYRELRRFDFAAGRPEPQSFVSTPGFDFSGHIVVDRENGKTLGIRIETDAETTHWFDARMKRIQQLADARFRGRINRLSCGHCGADDMVVLVESWSDQDPGSLWTYRAANDTWQLIGRKRKDVDPAQMATTDFSRFRARDGLEIPVWVTLPKRPNPSQPGPAVVLVHGGPWVRGGHWRWREYPQFLASRGYVVIEPEYRGGLGYGWAHHVAGRKQWGLAMQDDLADAVRWAVGKGWVDPKRVCIAGASYGGYATLMGLIRHPDVYRCGAAWIAVTDPRLMFKWSWRSDLTDEARLFNLPKLIGDPVADAKLLADAAPVEQAARIKAPVLLAFGGLDRRVPIEHGTRMRDALRAAGRAPEWVEYPEEGHGWLKQETRIDFARRLERFLAEHLR